VSVDQAGCSPLPIKILSSVSTVGVSDVAIASPRRARQGRSRQAPELYSILQAD
jgi:hypothetical protein